MSTTDHDKDPQVAAEPATDDEVRFDRWARDTGRSLRRPPPDDGVRDVAHRHQRQVRRRAAAVTVAALVLAAGVVGALVLRDSKETTTIVTPPTTTATTTPVASSSPVNTTAPAAVTDAAPVFDTGRATSAIADPAAGDAPDPAAVVAAALMSADKLGSDWADEAVSYKVADLRAATPECSDGPSAEAIDNVNVVSRTAGEVRETVVVFATGADASNAMDWHASDAGRACTLAVASATIQGDAPGVSFETWASPEPRLTGDRVVSYGITAPIRDNPVVLTVAVVQVGRAVAILTMAPEPPDGVAPVGSTDYTMSAAAFLLTQALTSPVGPNGTPGPDLPAGSGTVAPGTLVLTGNSFDSDFATSDENGTSITTFVTNFSGDLVGPAPARGVAGSPTASFEFAGTISGLGSGTLSFEVTDQPKDAEGRFTYSGPILAGTGDFTGYTGTIFFLGTITGGNLATYRVELSPPQG